jgi:hypothetical protein
MSVPLFAPTDSLHGHHVSRAVDLDRSNEIWRPRQPMSLSDETHGCRECDEHVQPSDGSGI